MSGEVSVMIDVDLVGAAVIYCSLSVSGTVADSRVSSIPVKSGTKRREKRKVEGRR